MREQVAVLHKKLSEAELAEREASAQVVVNERRENNLLRREDIMLQEIDAVTQHRDAFDSSGLGFPSGLVIDFAQVEDCDDLSRWNPDISSGVVDNLSNL